MMGYRTRQIGGRSLAQPKKSLSIDLQHAFLMTMDPRRDDSD